ncbi:MAG TPA: metallopeptidase TldD-related protein, partial [Elusimicrobiota bacterium]|nr:metallopeptidase TldD-related protein [Elusimicrobiota bacterium]
MICASLLAAVLLAGSARAAAPDAALERAMQAELSRAKNHLKEDGYPAIYHAALTVWDLEDWDRWSAMGAPRAEAWMAQRIVLGDVRVGGPSLDNHPDTPRVDYLGTPVSLGADEFALRHSLWRILDGDYKAATADFLRKRERIVSEGKADYETDDLAEEPPAVSTASRPASPWDRDRLARLEDSLSEPFRRDPSLLYAESHVSLRRLWTRRRDTEGLRVDKADDSARIEIEAAALSPDGLRETVSRDWSARVPQALPSEAELRRAGRAMLADLEELRVAATTSPFSAPALLDPSVSAALVFALGQRLSGEEQRDPAGAQTFRGRVGERVLSQTLTLTDDPTQVSFRGRPLYGHYDFDDEGVPARRVVLVERGELKGFLLSRYPVKGFPRSNGHGRASVGMMPTGTPGVLTLASSQPQPVEKLLARLLEECRARGKPYGLWIRDLRSASQQQGSGGQGSIRFIARVDLVDAATGKTTRVRDLDLVGTPLVMAESLVGAGDDSEASDVDQVAPASVIAPSLLLAEAELQRSETKPERAPILPPPQPFVPEPEQRAFPGKNALPQRAYIEVDRYLLSGWTGLAASLDAPGLAEWRQTRTPDGLVIDVKAVGAGPAG